MNIYLAITLFTFTIIVYGAIAELFTMLFRFQGLPDEKARFQVISLLTGCGFTTHESEMFLTSRSRRTLARYTMLFGYVFNITIVSAFINVFFSLKISEILSDIIGILIPVMIIVLLMVLFRIPSVRAGAQRLFERLAGRFLKKKTDNSVLLLDYIGEETIAQVTLNRIPEAFAGKPLSETGIKTENNILVMLVDRGKAEPATAQTVFQTGDKLTVFGNYAIICKAFEAEEQFDKE